MWISHKEFNELLAENRVFERLMREAEKQTAYAEAKLDSSEELNRKLEKEIEILRAEKKELLDDLLIASGVKMSKYQEALAMKQLDAEDKDTSSVSQTRQWAHEMTQNSIMSQEERNRRAIKLVEELEQEALLGGKENG